MSLLGYKTSKVTSFFVDCFDHMHNARAVYMICILYTALYCIRVLRALNRCMACTFSILFRLSLEHACCVDNWEHPLIVGAQGGKRSEPPCLLVI